MKKSLLLLLIISQSLGSFSQNTWTNVVEKGADPTGKVKCTQIIKKQIDYLASKGGGTLFFPAGTFWTGPIIMKSKCFESLTPLHPGTALRNVPKQILS